MSIPQHPDLERFIAEPFNAASARHLHLDTVTMENLMPRDLLNLHQNRFGCMLTSSDGASAEFDILADRANGLYHACIITHERDGDYVSELRAVGNAAGDAYRIEKMVLDNVSINPADRLALSDALAVFLSYKNAAFPNGEGPAVLFPRPDGDPAPLPDIPKRQQTSRLPPRRGH